MKLRIICVLLLTRRLASGKRADREMESASRQPEQMETTCARLTFTKLQRRECRESPKFSRI